MTPTVWDSYPPALGCYEELYGKHQKKSNPTGGNRWNQLPKNQSIKPALSFVEVYATPSDSNTTLWLGHRTNRSIRTEQAYVSWIKRYSYFHNVRHPAEMGAPEVQAFLTHLAVEGNVAASTQNPALSPPK